MSKYTKRLVTVCLLVFVSFVIYSIITGISRIGKTRIDITVIPEDAKVTINNSETSAGSKYVKPGTYVFTAAKAGFKTYTYEITIKKERTQVGLVPDPESEEAISWLIDNPDIQLEREAIGGTNAMSKGEEIENNTPIIASLPFTSVTGPFTIDYGYTELRKNGIFLLIRNSSPDGRKNALQWIREQQNIDPTDLEIRFSDFVNPLTDGAAQT